MKKGLLIVSVLVFIGIEVNAQSDFRSGYVIRQQGDTLFGEIDFRTDQTLSELCRFRKDKTQGSTDYLPKDIQGFQFKDGKYFVSKIVHGEPLFLEFLVKGRLNFYFYRENFVKEHYFLEKGNSGLVELPYEEEIKTDDDGNLYLYQSTKHNGILNFYLQDAPSLRNDIAAIKKPDQKLLIDLANVYQNLVCRDSDCIIYEKKLPLFKIEPEISFGENFYRNYENKFRPQIGIYAHIWMPRDYERLYFRTGVLYIPIIDNYAFLKVPITLEYVFPKRKIQPVFAYGYNFYGELGSDPGYGIVGATVSFSGGIKWNISKNLIFSIRDEVEFPHNDLLFFIPQLSLFTQSLSAGFYINLYK